MPDRPVPPSLTSEPDAPSLFSGRMGGAMLLALLLHGALLLLSYLLPEHRPPLRRPPIQVDVVKRPPPKEVKPPEVKPPAPEDRPTDKRDERPPPRPLPSLLRPVQKDQDTRKEDPQSPAVVLPQQPEQEVKPGPQKPLNLFDTGSMSRALGGNGSGALGPPPKTPNRLLKDERLDEKKEEEFQLVPEKGGGFKYDGPNFVAHIGPDGALRFDDRGPVGFAKGQSGFTFDLTDLAMRGGKQDPYASQKRRFRDFSAKLRDDLRRKNTESALDSALAHVAGDLSEIWQSQRPAAVRRREIYEYWVNCADDKEGGETQGLRARRQVEEFIRRHLGTSSPLAYTDEELRRFAEQRRGLPAFAPYAR